jgi:hypothetical protein
MTSFHPQGEPMIQQSEIEEIARAIASKLRVVVYEDDGQGRFESQQYQAEIEGIPDAIGAAYEVMARSDGARRGYDAAIAAIRSWQGHGLSASTDGRLEAVATDLEANREAALASVSRSTLQHKGTAS